MKGKTMARTFKVIGPDDGSDYLARLVTGVNAEMKDRGIVADSDAGDQSFNLCLSDAVMKLGGDWTARGEDYFIAFGGAPLSAITEPNLSTTTR